MNYNDISKAITAEDLIRRYNLDSLKTDRIQIKNMHTTLNRQYTIIKEFISYITPYKYQPNRLSTWFFNGSPTLENEPFSTFSEEEKESHIGDLYYDRETGEVFQLKKDEEFKWEQIEDNNLIQSLALANSEADTSDNKRNIFYETPITPYEIGDIWLDNTLIMRCRCARSEGEYNSADWIVQEKYSNELVLGDTRAVLDQFILSVEKNYATKVQLETTKDSILASVEATTTEIIETANGKYEYYDEQIAAININVGEIDLGVQNLRTDMDSKIEDLSSKFTLTAEEITGEVSKYEESITGQVTDLSSKVSQTASEVSSKVSKGDFGSYAQQYYDKFLLGFNNASNVVQIATNGISLYRSGSLKLNIDEYDLSFHQDGYHVGNIGTSQYSNDNSQKCLAFNLDSGGAYMGWFQRTSSSGSYYSVLSYCRAGKFGETSEGVHFYKNIYGHGYSLSGFNMANATANNYETVNNKSINVITNIDIDEEGNLIVEKSSIGVRNGMITSAPDNSEEV